MTQKPKSKAPLLIATAAVATAPPVAASVLWLTMEPVGWWIWGAAAGSSVGLTLAVAFGIRLRRQSREVSPCIAEAVALDTDADVLETHVAVYTPMGAEPTTLLVATHREILGILGRVRERQGELQTLLVSKWSCSAPPAEREDVAEDILSLIRMEAHLLAAESECTDQREPEQRETEGPSPSDGTLKYEMSSLFLKEALDNLVPPEQMFLVAGRGNGRSRTLERIVHVDLEDQTAVHVSANPDDLGTKILLIDRFGANVNAWFHSHPGGGPPSPSTVDWKQQRLFEAAYKVVGAVVTADGFIRFFASNPDFEVIIHGDLVEQVHEERHVFRLRQGDHGATVS